MTSLPPIDKSGGDKRSTSSLLRNLIMSTEVVAVPEKSLVRRKESLPQHRIRVAPHSCFSEDTMNWKFTNLQMNSLKEASSSSVLTVSSVPVTKSKKGKITAVLKKESPWQDSQLLQLHRERMASALYFHKTRRKKFTKLILNACKSLRSTSRPHLPDLNTALKRVLPEHLGIKYSRLLKALLEELGSKEVNPVVLPQLGEAAKYESVGVVHVPREPKERKVYIRKLGPLYEETQVLGRAMASFPPSVRRVMAEVLRPLETTSLVEIEDSMGPPGGEGGELDILISNWRASSRKGRNYLRGIWLPDALNKIREEALNTKLSQSRCHAVVHAFNNLLASKLQQVLIRSMETIIRWLSCEDEPWMGPRIKLYLVLEDNEITLRPDETEVYSAFMDVFDELNNCIQLYRGTWDEPQPPKVPVWRMRAEEKKKELKGIVTDKNLMPEFLRPLEPKRETLVVTLSDAQWGFFKDTINKTLSDRYLKCEQIADQITLEWRPVLCGEIKKEVDAFLMSDAKLDAYGGKIQHYLQYVEKASHVPTSGTVHVFRLEYHLLRQSLLALTSQFVQVLRDKLIDDHRKEMHRLSGEFEKIRNRVQQTPQSTSELFTQMEAVEEARRITIHKLVDEVAEMTARLKTILNVVHLTEEDLNFTASVITWPQKLRPVLEKSVEALEDYKQEFEETLVEKTAEVNRSLDRIQQLVVELEDLNEVSHEVRKIDGRLDKVTQLVSWVNKEEGLFKFPLSHFPLLKELKECLIPYDELFTLVMKWRKYEKHWMDGDFKAIDPDFIDEETEELTRELARLRKTFKTKFKQQALEGDPRKARMNLEDPNPNNLPGPLRVCALTLGHIKSFKDHLPLVTVLCNKGLRDRHWVKLNAVAGFDITPNAGTSLRKVIAMDLGHLLEDFEVVSTGASREYSLESALTRMKETWATMKLETTRHPELLIEEISGLDDLATVVDDHLIMTHTIKNSPFVGPFTESVKLWGEKMLIVKKTVNLWSKFQALYVELTPVFTMPDLPSLMPKEDELYNDVKERWLSIMDTMISTTQLLELASDVKLQEELSEAFDALSEVQQAAYHYMDLKRAVFPRFYFMSNEELTSLLCEKDPTRFDVHIRKSFEGVYKIRIDRNIMACALVSIEGEIVQLVKRVPLLTARKSIENWHLQFQEAITETLKCLVTSCIDWWTTKSGWKSADDVLSIVPKIPFQVIVIVHHIMWTADVHEALHGGTQALKECLCKLEKEVESIISCIRQRHLPTPSSSSSERSPTSGTDTDKMKGVVNKLSTKEKLSSKINPKDEGTLTYYRILSVLLLSAVHCRDVVKDLVQRDVVDEEAFEWQSQQRFYYSDGEVEPQILHVRLPWGWEYLGAKGRLVATPLTIRAQHAFATAYNAHLTAAPEGPAGTGKTETVKDIAHSLAMHCLVFNCSEGLDYIAIGRFLTGVAASGTWACFDEFNLLEISVLSVAAQQFLTLLNVRREGSLTFSLEGREPLALDTKGFLVVTMNPLYKGRVNLPDNLQVLLRPVAMLVADQFPIAEVSLMASGFVNGRALATRIINVMDECKCRLYSHAHYDFGLRAVKTILSAAGRIKLSQTSWSETEVVLKALREVNKPKLVGEDAYIFEDILQDYFLQVPPTPRSKFDHLEENIKKICEEEGLVHSRVFQGKVLQLYDTLQERQGVMIVGEPYAGKTTIVKVLSAAISMLAKEKEIQIERFNPKTLTQAQLIGKLDPISREWTEGVLSKAVRSLLTTATLLVCEAQRDASFPSKEMIRLSVIWVKAAFLFALTWCLTGSLDKPSKEAISNYIKQLIYGRCSDYPIPPIVETIGCPYPPEGTIFDYVFDPKQRSFWRPWSDIVKLKEIIEVSEIWKSLIPTSESCRLQYLLSLFGRTNINLMAVNEAGSGCKSAVLNYLTEFSIKTHDVFIYPVSPSSTVCEFKKLLLDRLDTSGGGTAHSAKGKRRLLVLLEDLHLAAQDTHMSRPVNEVIRESIQNGSWIHHNGISRVSFENIQLICRCSLSSCRNGIISSLIDKRCLMCFNVISFQPLTGDSVSKIFLTKVNIFLRNGGFIPDMFTVVSGIVEGTLSALRYCGIFKPSPLQPVYLFNMSTAMRIIHSLAFVKKEHMDTKRHFVRLWVNEVFRELGDCLLHDEELIGLRNELYTSIKRHFKDKPRVIFDKLSNDDGSVTEESLTRVRWGLIGSPEIPSKERCYEELMDSSAIMQTIKDFLCQYSADKTNAPLNIITVKYVVEHVLHATRVFGRQGGHMMLIGVGGSGRRSVCRIASHICGHTMFLPRITSHNDYAEVREAFRLAVIRAGVEDGASVVVLGDDILHHPRVLHLVHMMITTSHIPDLLSTEDYSNVMARLTLSTEEESGSTFPDESTLRKCYLERVWDLVHIALLVPPSDKLLLSLQDYPSLAHQMTVDYYKAWPNDALQQVGQESLKSVSLRKTTIEDVIAAAANIHQRCIDFSEQMVNKNKWCPQMTPSTYLYMLEEFKRLFALKQAKITTVKKKYISGIEKLEFASSQISVMKELLDSLGPQIEEAANDVKNMMELIEKESKEVEARREIVHVEEEEAEVHAIRARCLQEECQAELQQALPALYEAIEALNTLKPGDITVVKSMKNPPQAIKIVMAAVCIMLEIKPDKIKTSSGKMTIDYWSPSKRLLTDLSFLQQLQEYDKDNISDVIMEKINKDYMRLAEFDPVVVAKASSAAEGLCRWIRAMSNYHAVAQIVAPKREKLAMAEKELQEKMEVVGRKKMELKELERKLSELQKRFSLTCTEKEKYEAERKMCSLKLERAEKLIRGLGGEKSRWKEEAEKAEKDLQKLPGDILLTSAILAYGPPLLPAPRSSQIKVWKELISGSRLEISSDYAFLTCVDADKFVSTWCLEGLPSDSFSTENAAIIKTSIGRWPLLIDPDEVGTRWLQKHEASNGLVTLRLRQARSDMNYIKNTLAECLPRGTPLLLLDTCGDPPHLLQNIISKNVYKEDDIEMVDIADLTLKYNNNFRLFMVTRDPRPSLSLDLISRLNLVNFTVTVSGLYDHLRQILVMREKPELEDQRQNLIVVTCEHQKALEETEEKILSTLCAARGNILESEEAIMILDETKKMADEIQAKQRACKETEATISRLCKEYEVVSKPSASLYMMLNRLRRLSNLYHFPLDWFLQIYIKVIEATPRSAVLSRRLNSLRDHLLSNVYSAVIKGLTSSHRMVFAFLLCIHFLKWKGDGNSTKLVETLEDYLFHFSSQKEITQSLKADVLTSEVTSKWPDVKSFLLDFQKLQETSCFEGLLSSVEESPEKWVTFLKTVCPKQSSVPSPWNQLPPLPWFVLAISIRRDKVLQFAEHMVFSVLGNQFTQAAKVNLLPLLVTTAPIKGKTPRTPRRLEHGVIPETSPPYLLVTSSGVDLLQEVVQVSHQKQNIHLKIVSLGQGQAAAAESSIKEGQEIGAWTILQNLHHMPFWMDSLVSLIHSIYHSPAALDIHPRFRLILTSLPCDDLPTSLLRSVEKVMIDAPTDFHSSLMECVKLVYQEAITWELDPNDFDSEEAGFVYRTVYGLAVFHAVVSKRKSYGKQSWVSSPIFTDADLYLALSIVKNFVTSGRPVDLNVLDYLVGKIFYGGRMRNKQDQLVICSLFCTILKISTQDTTTPREMWHSNEGLSEEKVEPEEGLCMNDLFPDFIGEMEDILAFCKTLQDVDSPSVLGLPSGVQKKQEILAGEEFLLALANVGGTEMVRVQEHFVNLDFVSSLFQKLPDILEMVNIPSGDIFYISLKREVLLLNSVVEAVRENLKALIKSQNVENRLVAQEIKSALIMGTTPSEWASLLKIPPPSSALGFIVYLGKKVAFFKNWMHDGSLGTVWLGAFEYPLLFLSCFRRRKALLCKRPLHHLVWSFEFHLKAENEEETKTAITIEHLWLKGALWDHKKGYLSDDSSGVILHGFPNLILKPSLTSKTETSTVGGENFRLNKHEDTISASCDSPLLDLADIFATPDEVKLDLFLVHEEDLWENEDDESLLGTARSYEKISLVSDDNAVYRCPLYAGSPAGCLEMPILSIPLLAGPKGAHYWTIRHVALYTCDT